MHLFTSPYLAHSSFVSASRSSSTSPGATIFVRRMTLDMFFITSAGIPTTGGAGDAIGSGGGMTGAIGSKFCKIKIN